MASKLTLETIVLEVKQTLCQNLDLERVGTSLTEEGKIPRHLAKFVKKAMRKKDNNIFFSVLKSFDLQSFVIFLETLDQINDKKHNDILSILCHDLRHLSLDSEPNQDMVLKLQSIVVKHLPSQPAAPATGSTTDSSTPATDSSTVDTTILATEFSALASLDPPAPLPTSTCYPTHPVEKYCFNKFGECEIYSFVHEVTVKVKPEHFPANQDTFDLLLTANDYSLPISMAPGYTGVYSALLDFKCEPQFDRFQGHVTVTIPHCAVGDSMEDTLCVLSASDGETELREDTNVEILSITKYHITFTTTHFSPYRVGSTKHRKQKSYHVPVQRKRLSARPESSPLVKFAAVLFKPLDTSSLTHWQFTFILTYYTPSHAKEIERCALGVLSGTNLAPGRVRPFTFQSDAIAFQPSGYTEKGWSVSTDKPAAITKECVELYWCLSSEEREVSRLFLPCITYDVFKSDVASNSNLSIELNGSKSLLTLFQPISFEVMLHCEQGAPVRRTINLIRDMYSNHSLLIEGLSGHQDCSDILLLIGDADCCTLLCEISFHLCQWEDMGRHLGIQTRYIELIRRQYQLSSFESAFQMLAKWLGSSVSPPPNLKMLVDSLCSVGLQLDVSTTWTIPSCTAEEPKILNEAFFAKFSKKINSRYWEFIARFLHMSETDIENAKRSFSFDVEEQIYNILWQWKKQQKETVETYIELYNAFRCVRQHTSDSTLDAILNYLNC